MTKDFKIQRCITFYTKNGDEFIGEKVIEEKDFSLKELVEIFGNKVDDPLLYHQYDIDSEKANMLNSKIKFGFQFDKYDYFLETFSLKNETPLGKGVRLKEN